MQTNTTRDKTIDFIKGILILFVILGHTTLGLTDMYSFDDTMYGIANVIYSFTCLALSQFQASYTVNM